MSGLCKNQHRVLCRECPWRRDSPPGQLGGSHVLVYVGQGHAGFWMPCHEATNYQDPNWKTDTTKPECVGAAIYRANNKVDTLISKALLRMEPDTDIVFANPAELVVHHKQHSARMLSIEQATEMFADGSLVMAAVELQLRDAKVKLHLKPKE